MALPMTLKLISNKTFFYSYTNKKFKQKKALFTIRVLILTKHDIFIFNDSSNYTLKDKI